MKIKYATYTDVGNRENNEDYVGCSVAEDDNRACFVLCDGLGGHGAGEVASQLVADTILKEYRVQGQNPSFLGNAIWKAQEDLLALQEKQRKKNEMKTTLVALQIVGSMVCWAHIGDSRLYYFKKKKLQERTMDHSVPQMLVNAGEIKEKDIRNHPDRNRLLRVMGMEWEGQRFVVHENVEIREQAAFLMCSDGFWELIDERKMEKCLKRVKTPQDWIDQMMEIVLQNGKNVNRDNTSAIAVFVEV